jgi:AcrR family transcriptional regulator
MSRSENENQGARRRYHHGNLREALVIAALDLISKKGPAGFTFADAARAAGVSPAAPYRHYKDRDALLLDVAQQGFEAFARALESAWDGGKPNAREAFDRLGRAYLNFARTKTAYFVAMFESGLSATDHPEMVIEGNRAFGILCAATGALVESIPAERRPPAQLMALHIWAVSHGIASLFARGDRARHPIPLTPEEVLETATHFYLNGIGVPGK